MKEDGFLPGAILGAVLMLVLCLFVGLKFCSERIRAMEAEAVKAGAGRYVADQEHGTARFEFIPAKECK